MPPSFETSLLEMCWFRLFLTSFLVVVCCYLLGSLASGVSTLSVESFWLRVSSLRDFLEPAFDELFLFNVNWHGTGFPVTPSIVLLVYSLWILKVLCVLWSFYWYFLLLLSAYMPDGGLLVEASSRHLSIVIVDLISLLSMSSLIELESEFTFFVYSPTPGVGVLELVEISRSSLISWRIFSTEFSVRHRSVTRLFCFR